MNKTKLKNILIHLQKVLLQMATNCTYYVYLLPTSLYLFTCKLIRPNFKYKYIYFIYRSSTFIQLQKFDTMQNWNAEPDSKETLQWHTRK